MIISTTYFRQLVSESLFHIILRENQLPEDENGNYYHGTLNKWNVRRGGFIEDNGAIWFADFEDYAMDYSGDGGKIIIVQLNYHNPLECGNIDMYDDFVWNDASLNIVRDEAIQSGSTMFKMFKGYSDKLNVDVWELVDIYEGSNNVEAVYDMTRSPKFAELCKQVGYDAIKANESGCPTIGVFNNKQIHILKVKKYKGRT